MPDPADEDMTHGTLEENLDPVQYATFAEPMSFLVSIDVLANTYTVSLGYK